MKYIHVNQMTQEQKDAIVRRVLNVAESRDSACASSWPELKAVERPTRYIVEFRQPQPGERFFSAGHGQHHSILTAVGDCPSGLRPVIISECK